MDFAVIHYDEIGLKGKNRKFFEARLQNNILKKLGKLCTSSKKESGQISFEIVPGKEDEIRDVLTKVPGVAHFSFAKRLDRDVDVIKNYVLELMKEKTFETFKINTQRQNKNFPLSSMELSKEVGALVAVTLDKPARMKNPDVEVKIIIADKFAYVSVEKINGVGGLPTDSKQKVVSLLSGGFDSPVASYMMMKRGCEVIFVHCQNQKVDACSVKNKIYDIAKQLSKFQIKTRLFVVDFESIQKRIIMDVKAEQRMLMYRRFMIKFADEVARRFRSKFIVTGDSMSQVASQTMDNLYATYSSSYSHIFSPLIGMNKVEIIDIAHKIGTFDICTLPYGDCCSYFLPKHPELKGSKSNLDDYDAVLSLDEEVVKIVDETEVIEFD